MGTIEEIESQISGLSKSEFEELRNWILERDNAMWDEQIMRDAQAGRFDAILQESREEYRTGRARKL